MVEPSVRGRADVSGPASPLTFSQLGGLAGDGREPFALDADDDRVALARVHGDRRMLGEASCATKKSSSRTSTRPTMPTPSGSGSQPGRGNGRMSTVIGSRATRGSTASEAGAVVGGKLLELEVEHLGDRLDRTGRTSSTRSVRSSSCAMVVNCASSSPQAVIHSVNGAGSRSTLSAYPCVVTQRETWTPMDAIFRGPWPRAGAIQTPVSPRTARRRGRTRRACG